MLSLSRISISIMGTMLIASQSSGIEQECSHSKEGTPHTFHAVFKIIPGQPLEILWTKNYQGVSKCRQVDGCKEFIDTETYTSLKLLDDGTCQSDLTIKNVTEKELGMWRLNYLGPALMEHKEDLFTCSFKLEDEPNIKNHSNDQKEKSLVMCLVIVSTVIFISTVVVTLICLKKVQANETIKKTLFTLCHNGNEKSSKCANDECAAVTEILFQKV